MKLNSLPSKLSIFLVGIGLLNSVLAQDAGLTTPEERAGYSIGINIGGNLLTQGLAGDINIDSLIMGISDAISGDLKLNEEEIMLAIQEFTALQQAKIAAQMEAETAASQQFLVDNGQRDGVTTTASGLQYEVLASAGSNGRMPSETDTVNVHYHGTLTDGTVFDSSVERGEPVEFPLNGVIPGWTEGLQLMREGDKFRFFIPSDLAYGANGAPPVIGPNATLIFDVELLGIQ